MSVNVNYISPTSSAQTWFYPIEGQNNVYPYESVVFEMSWDTTNHSSSYQNDLYRITLAGSNTAYFKFYNSDGIRLMPNSQNRIDISGTSVAMNYVYRIRVDINWENIDWETDVWKDIGYMLQTYDHQGDAWQLNYQSAPIFKVWKYEQNDLINNFDLFVFPKMSENDKEMIAYYSARPNEVIRLKGIESVFYQIPYNQWILTGSTLNWNCTTQNAKFLRDWNDEPMSAYKLETKLNYWEDNGSWHMNGLSCSAHNNVGILNPSVWDSMWVQFTSSGLSEIVVSSPLNPDKNIRLIFSVNNGPIIISNWLAETALTAENPSFLQFKSDLRTSLYEAIDQKVREEVSSASWRYIRFSENDPLGNFNLLLANNTERTNRIDSSIKQIEYNTESAINALGEPEVKAVYSSLYGRLKEFDYNLGNLIDNTLTKTVENYERSEQLLATLENKAKEETLVQYSTTISQFPIEKMEIWLYSQYNESYWNIDQYVSIRNEQLFIDLPPIDEITNIQTIDKFVPWYIHIWPKRETIQSYQTFGDKRFIFYTNKDITDILWSTLYDVNGLSYKIINYISTSAGNEWILDKNIDSNAIGSPLTIYYNYFDPQVIKMDISWLHNYIPKDIPVGSLYQPITEQVVEDLIETNISQETVIPSKMKDYNKEIF
jgi:hypothetical protein